MIAPYRAPLIAANGVAEPDPWARRWLALASSARRTLGLPGCRGVRFLIRSDSPFSRRAPATRSTQALYRRGQLNAKGTVVALMGAKMARSA